jgi:hypothetical protein
MNSGGVSWFGAHTLSVAPSQSGQQEFLASTFPLGSAASETFPQDRVTKEFTITPPTQPGTYNLSIVLKDGLGKVLASSPSQQIVVSSPGTDFDNANVTVIEAPGSLNVGQSANVRVFITNTGTTTWDPATYVLGLGRGMRISLPQQTAGISSTVVPTGTRIISFTIICSASGQGWFTAQMRSTIAGGFGQQASRNVVCH